MPPPGDAVSVTEHGPGVGVIVTVAGVVVTLIVLLPPQLVTVIVALLFTVKVVDVPPCAPVKTAPGVALQV